MVATTKKPMTAEELLAMPDPADGTHYELLEGELLTIPPSSDSQGVVAGEIASLLGEANRKVRRGAILVADVGYKLTVDPDTVLAPDAAFVLSRRIRPKNNAGDFLQVHRTWR